MNDEYTKEIAKLAAAIIENKNYPLLSLILTKYDMLVQEDDDDIELPFWCKENKNDI